MKYNEIDKVRWDFTIDNSLNRMPYAYSWYLDAVSPGWEALISYDYAFVMPLPVKQKLGIKYVIHPRWVQQLGVFSKHVVDERTIKAFLCKIPYLSYDFNINFGNKGQFEAFPNMLLDLHQSYEVLEKGFSQNTKRNIAKAQVAELKIQSIEYQTLVEFWNDVNVDSPQELKDKLPVLCQAVKEHNGGAFYGAYSSENVLIAVLMTIETANRIIYLVPASNEQGKHHSAMFLLVNELLKKNAGSGMIFDFEGSKIPGVARFYKGFGAQIQSYYHVKRLRPDWLVKLINK